MKFTKEKWLALLVIFICSVSLVQAVAFDNFFSIANSILGITGAILFLSGSMSFKYPLWLWIAFQSIIIESVNIDPNSPVSFRQTILDMSQLVSLKIGLKSDSGNGGILIYLNLTVFFYFFLLRYLKTDNLIGKTFNLLVYKENAPVEFSPDTSVTIIRKLNIQGEIWLLGNLSYPFIFNNARFDKLLIKLSDGELMEIFRLIPEEYIDSDFLNSVDILDFVRADWVKFE